MISYFIPISLLVIGGFALGLLVGRLAWASQKVGAIHDLGPAEEVPLPTVTDSASFPEQDASPQELPIWQMKEVRSRQRTATGPAPAELNLEPAQPERR